MPMDQQQRAEHVKKFEAFLETDVAKSKRVAKILFQGVRKIRRDLERVDAIFQTLTGADQAAKQTTLFDVISAETDGDLILHDLGQYFDSAKALANDHRQPGDAVLSTPFTDADVSAYLP